MNQFLYSIRQLEKRYENRKRKRKMMMNILQEMNQVIKRIKVLRDNEIDYKRYIFLLK